MTEEIKNLLDEAIVSQLTDIPKLKTGSNEKTTAIDDLVKLYRLDLDRSKMMIDSEEKQFRREMDDRHGDFDCEIRDREEMLKHDQLSEQRIDRMFRIGTAAVELVVPLIFYGIWMNKGFKFEETGTFTSSTFKGLFNRFRPTKK